MKAWSRFKEQYKRIKRAIITPVSAFFGMGTLWLLLATCRYRNNGLDKFTDIASKEPCIIMLWHNRLLVAPYFFIHFTKKLIFSAFISNSRDGEFLARAIKMIKRGRTIRVPHNARHQALKEVIEHLQNTKEIVVITPDGPRGPKYQVKPGIVMAAREASAAIIPFSWTADRYWELKTWDGMRIPKPFSTIDVTFGDAIRIPKDTTEPMEETTVRLGNLLAK